VTQLEVVWDHPLSLLYSLLAPGAATTRVLRAVNKARIAEVVEALTSRPGGKWQR